MSIVALDNFSTSRLIDTDNFPVLFRVELGGEFSGIDQVTEHDRELPSFRVGRRGSNARCDLREGLVLGSRVWCWLSRLRDDFLSTCRVTSPDEPLPIIISHRVH